MFDIFKNHRIERFKDGSLEQSIGNVTLPSAGYIDMWANNQLPNRALIIIDVTSVGTGGTLDLIAQDSTDNSTWDADFCTAAQITAAGLYIADLVDFYRYMRLYAAVGTDAVTWSGYLITFEDQRRPVTQSGTAMTLTYGTGRKAKVSAT